MSDCEQASGIMTCSGALSRGSGDWTPQPKPEASTTMRLTLLGVGSRCNSSVKWSCTELCP